MTTPARRPARIRIERIWPELDCGRYPVKRAVGDPAEVWATIVRDGHEVLGAALRYRPPGARRWREAPMRPFPLDPDRWHGSFTPDALGRWQFGVVAWVDRVASWKHELERKVAAGQSDLASELSEGAALLGVPALTVEEGLAAKAGDRSEQTVSDGALEITADSERATFGSWYELFPRSWGGFAGVEKLLPEFAKLGFDVALSAARAPDRAHAPQGPQQRPHRAPLRPGQPVGDRQRGRRAHRAAPRPRGRGGVREPDRARVRARHRDRARLRAQLLARPPLAARASGLVPPPPGRHAQVRREPAQALPGHLQPELRQRGLAGALGGAARRHPALGRPRRHRVPGRQPAHEADRILGVADRGCPEAAPGDGLPRRGVHAPRAHGDAREGRLQPVLHLLHVAQHEGRARRVHDPAHALRAAAVLPPELLRQHARHPARLPRPGRSPGVRGEARAGGHALALLRHLLGLRALRERAAHRGQRGVPRLREVRDQEAEARRAAAPADRPPQRGTARQPGAPAHRQPHVPRDRERASHRVHQAHWRQRGDRVREPGSGRGARGRRHDPAELGLPAAFDVTDLLGDGAFTWRAGRNYVRLEPGLQQAHLLHVEL